jgi:hypothetical protein
MTLIELHTLGKTVFVNPDHIISVDPQGPVDCVVYLTGDYHFAADMSAAAMVRAISTAINQGGA